MHAEEYPNFEEHRRAVDHVRNEEGTDCSETCPACARIVDMCLDKIEAQMDCDELYAIWRLPSNA